MCPPQLLSHCVSDSENRRMRRRPCSGGPAAAWAPGPLRSRTSVLLLGCLLAVAGGLRAEVVVDADAGGGLEASMHSSLLQDFREASEGSRTRETQQNPAEPGSSWDTSAVVGRLFRAKLPRQAEGVNMADVVEVSRSFTSCTCAHRWTR